MTEPSNLSEQERADLVAYLDGELSGDAARSLETKLSLHPAARAEADALRRTWELLDFLPSSPPSPRFTHRTLERLSPLRAGERRWRTRCLGLAWAAALLLAGWGGYAGYNRLLIPRQPSETPAIREREWIERLPKKIRDDLERLPAEEREAQVIQLREQERQQSVLWKRPLGAAEHPKQPTRPSELPADAKHFVEKQLLPHLTADEKRRYHQAEGHWPAFPQTVKELAKHHPVLPPLPHKAIVRFDDLPDKAKAEAGSKPSWERREETWQRLKRVEGKWPEWALTFHNLLSPPQRQRMPPLGASRPEELPAEVRAFIRKTLRPKISPQEWRALHALEGRWPEYPLHLLRLAEKHTLEVPGMSLPSSSEW